MDLSAEQMGAGSSGDTPSWELVELPNGPQPLPAWALDLAIWWGDGYGNSPDCKLKATENLRRWPDKRFRFEAPGRYVAEHPDGRAEVYYHGRFRPAKLKRLRMPDGTILPPHAFKREAVEEEYDGFATGPDEGFGGSHFHITMEDGTPVVLRGPWHSLAPAGFVEVAYVNWSDERSQRPWRGEGPSWLRTTATGGLYIREELFIRLFARFQSHLQLARVTEFFSGGRRYVSLQPLKPEWDVPKRWILERERVARQAERDARWNARGELLGQIQALGFSPEENDRMHEHYIRTPDGGRITWRLLEGGWYEYGPKLGLGQRASGKDLPSLLQRLGTLTETSGAPA